MKDPASALAYRLALALSFERCFAPWSRMPPEVWAEEVYRLPSGMRFKWEYAPYARRILQSYFDRSTIETVLMMYSRGLKSTTILLLIGYLIDQMPRRILCMWPTNGQAEKWSKDILTGELFDTTPPLNWLGTKALRRTGSNTLLHKAFPGGLIDIFGANAPGDVRRAKGSCLIIDEEDAIETTETDEGDISSIFWKRGDEYPDTIRIASSYPSIMGRSKVTARMERTDGNQWLSTCVLCGGEPYVMHRSQIVYEKDHPQDARLTCPRCKGLLTDAQRYDMAHRQGFECWKPQRDFRGRRGFHANAMLWPHPVDAIKYPGGFLQMVAEREIADESSENPRRSKRVTVNTVDADPWDPNLESEKPPQWFPLWGRREEYTDVPEGGLVVLGSADLQLNRIELEWKAWGRREISWGLHHVVIDGDIRDKGTWELLKKELIGRKFKAHNGAPILWSLCFVDGGKWAEWLFRFLGDLAQNPIENVSGKVRAVKGFGAQGHPVITDWRSIAKNLKGYHVGTWQVKDMLNSRLNLEPIKGEPDPDGYMHWNKSFHEGYFKQLCTAKVTIDFEKGDEVRKFLNDDQLADEGLDLNVYNYAAFRRRQWNFDAIETEIMAFDPENGIEIPKEEEWGMAGYRGGAMRI